MGRVDQENIPPLGELDARPQMKRPRGPEGPADAARRMSVAEDGRSGGCERGKECRWGCGHVFREGWRLGHQNRREGRSRQGGRMTDGRPAPMRPNQYRRSHRDINTRTAAARPRPEARVLGRFARTDPAANTAPIAQLDRHVPVRSEAEHGSPVTSWDASQYRENEIEIGHEVETGAHESKSLVMLVRPVNRSGVRQSLSGP